MDTCNKEINQNDNRTWKRRFKDVSLDSLNTKKNTVAIIVTYNPVFGRLQENLDAIIGQVDAVLIFDNGSRNIEDLERLIVQYGCFYHLECENLGLSCALNSSISFAERIGAERVLLLDQDSVAENEIINKLVPYIHDEYALASPQIVDRNKQEGFNPRETTREVRRAITSGMIISIKAWREVKGFDERLFVDWVDFDFCANLRAHGYKIMHVGNAMLLHEMGKREYVFTLPCLGGGRPFYRTNHSASRQKDKARSWAIIRRKYGLSRIGIEERFYMDTILLRDLLLERNRPIIIKNFWRGSREGANVVRNREKDYNGNC